VLSASPQPFGGPGGGGTAGTQTHWYGTVTPWQSLLATDTRLARRATYTFYRWRRRRARLPALATRRTA